MNRPAAGTVVRGAVSLAGAALIGWGVYGIVANVGVGGWAPWFAGAAVLHDGVLVPLVLVAGVLTGFVPAAYRGAVRAALVIAGCVTVVALPMVLGEGRRADEPSRLPLPYDRNFAIVLAFVAAVAVTSVAVRGVARRRRRTR
ncbi:hypothetical protein ACFOY4_28320 [Actinomadura syzygii]|uniref:hypothetical protein n=1 Tax=Actinomadura syzygii TaxID=1427538 RepID=UPI001CA37D2E|nr:hypothetical protein [Actinomadura syzygii]